MKRGGWKREVRVATGLRKHLHFSVDTAIYSARGIRQSKVSVNERVTRRTGAVHIAKRSMLVCKCIAEVKKLPARIPGSIGRNHSMMQVNFNFAPSCGTMLCQPVDESLVVLF